MTMNPETGEGFDAVAVDTQDYFDPQAHSDSWPGVLGLEMRKITYWQGDVEFYVYEEIGPKFGDPWPDGSVESSPSASALAPIAPSGRTPSPVYIVPKHEWTPCFEDDGVTPTQGDLEQRHWIDITLLGAYGGDIRFPVMPEEFGADFTHEYWTPRVVGLGEIIMPGGQSMETISWDSFFPSSYDSDYCVISPTELEDPRSITARLIWTMRFKMDCMLLVGGGLWNDRVVITNFNYRHRAGEIFDIYYTITLKRYRAPIVTTSINPDTIKDRWYKDPRYPGGQTITDAPVQEGAAPEEDNPNSIPIEPDSPPAGNLDTDFPPGSLPGRGTIITIETSQVLGQPAKTIRDPGGPAAKQSETFTQVVARLSKEGPNDMASMLALNQWVSDNNYNPYTTMLPIGSGVRYYKEHPVSAAKPTTIKPIVSGSLSGAYPSGALYPPGTDRSQQPALRGSFGDLLGQLGGALNPPRLDPSTVAPHVPTNTPQERPTNTGGIRR